MRSHIAGMSLAFLVVLVGCNIAPHRRDLPPSNNSAIPPVVPKIEDLVKYLNDNAERIEPGQAISCGDVFIDVDSPQGKFGLKGMMRCQTPRNFALRGIAFGSPEVEIGSNDQEFWYWIKRNQPPYLYHCSYEALGKGAYVPFPFQPDMVVNTLGLARYDTAGRYDLKVVNLDRNRKAIELIEQTTSPQNKRIQKVTVFDINEATCPDPQVLAHILRDEQGKPICVANVRRAQRIGAKGAIIPKEIVFEWPEQKLKMTMRLDGPQLIDMPPEKVARVFTRQHLTMQAFDLATQVPDGAGLRRAGATEPIYRR